MKMREQLLEQYENLKRNVNFQDDLAKRLSAPLCLHVPDKWENSKTRVLIIGQETLGWDFLPDDRRYGKDTYYDWPYPPIANWQDFKCVDDSAAAMTYGYQCFEFSRHQPINRRSPFWRAYREVRKAVGDQEDGMDTCVLWTNLFKVSLDEGSVIKNGTKDEKEAIREASREILRAEIEILKPTAVIFFTGPNYNQTLYSIFSGMELLSFHGRDPEKTAQLIHPNLPDQTWRTYHPAYLLRSKQWVIIDQISNEIEK